MRQQTISESINQLRFILEEAQQAGDSSTTANQQLLLQLSRMLHRLHEAPLKMNFGEDYILGARTSAEPVSIEPGVQSPKGVTDSQVGKVVHDRVEELEYCWLRLPVSKRVATSATLHLAIEASGAVAGVTIDGVLPAGMAKCITAAASKWTFPSADSGCEIEHGISMGMKSDTVR